MCFSLMVCHFLSRGWSQWDIKSCLYFIVWPGKYSENCISLIITCMLGYIPRCIYDCSEMIYHDQVDNWAYNYNERYGDAYDKVWLIGQTSLPNCVKILYSNRSTKNIFWHIYVNPQYLSFPIIYNTWGQNIWEIAQNNYGSWKNTLKYGNLLATLLHHPTLTCPDTLFPFPGIIFWCPHYHCVVFST